MNKVCVMGLGYIGLPTAAMFATHGLQVIGVDINDRVINTLQKGQVHIQEPGLGELVHQALESGHLRVARSPEEADAFIIAVPTPFIHEEGAADADPWEVNYKRADMQYVISATEAIVPFLKPGNLVVLESTSPPLTTLNLVKPILEETGLRAGLDFSLAYVPERVLPGKILKELVENARVIGGIDPESARAGQELYATFVKGEIVLTDATTAEMVKLMENTYRDVNIAIANEFSRLADRFRVNIWEAIAIANRHPRVKILQPGPGVGGHCIGVDPWFLVEAAPDLTPLIRTARHVNDSQPQFVVDLIERRLGEHLKGRRVAALGLAYKPNVDDLRESPAIEICRLMACMGAQVTAYEPHSPAAQFEEFTTAGDLASVLKDADILLVLVDHDAFRSLTPAQVSSLTSARLVLDTVNLWASPEWREAGFEVLGLTQV